MTSATVPRAIRVNSCSQKCDSLAGEPRTKPGSHGAWPLVLEVNGAVSKSAIEPAANAAVVRAGTGGVTAEQDGPVPTQCATPTR